MQPLQPLLGQLNGQSTLYRISDMAYGELALVGQHSTALHSLDWQTQHPVRLTPLVQRLTAPNPGTMTGPGTNSYLVGEPRTGYIAIDPGPDDAAHLHRLWRAALDAAGQPGDIRHIVCTHSHPDHSPGAQPLQALCAQAGRAAPPILGLPSGPYARSNCSFTPDRELLNQELLMLIESASEGDLTDKKRITLRILHTPGHASNHLCLLLLGDATHAGLLFSGDHILNGSTTVIDPPDGNMAAYLDALDLLSTACTAHQIDYILPAHGWVLGYPGSDADESRTNVGRKEGGAVDAIARLKAHRLKREAKIISVMHTLPQGSPDDWVTLAYDDTPTHLWPVAKRSLLAHVERIRALGLATRH